MFHTAQWDHTFNWKDKEVIVVGKCFSIHNICYLCLHWTIGNGCSATQAIPEMCSGPGAAKMITQFSRQSHWLAERPNPEYSALFKWTMKWIPLAMRMYRAKLYWEKERDFKGFDIETGAEIRSGWSKEAADYIRANAPAKYRDFLVPKTEIGCKRRVNDTNYLATLHKDNVDLIYDDPIEEIIATGVRTKSGKTIAADAIVLAHGFETQKPFGSLEIFGERSTSIQDHVSKQSTKEWNMADLTSVVEPSQRRSALFISRNVSVRVSELLHANGPEHPEWSSFCHLHHRVPNQLCNSHYQANLECHKNRAAVVGSKQARSGHRRREAICREARYRIGATKS